jgi:hypothetical protein
MATTRKTKTMVSIDDMAPVVDTAALNSTLETKVTARRAKNARLVETYKGEKKVPVQGSPMYRPYFGNNMPIILNGIAIYVPLDGQQYEIPESFAAIFLDRISRIDEQINMRKQMAAISDNIESYAGERNLIQKV